MRRKPRSATTKPFPVTTKESQLVMETPASGSRLELAAAVLLAMAAIATAWASYQSARWHGKQAQAQSASIAARVESTRQASVAQPQAQVDLALFTQWIDAYARRRGRAHDFYRKRFRAEFEPAFEAWVATRPLRNDERAALAVRDAAVPTRGDGRGGAPRGEAAAFAEDVGRNIQRADNYLLAVVLFAISLFFAALSTRLRSRDSDAILGLGYVLFVGHGVWLATQPVSVSV